MRIFSNKQIIFTAMLAGPLPAAYLLSKNYLNLKQKRSAFIARLIGSILALITYVIVIISFGQWIIPTGIFKQSRTLGYLSLTVFFFIFQSILAFIYLFYGRRKYSFDTFLSSDSKYFSFWHILPAFLSGIALTAYIFIQGPFRFMVLAIYLLPNIYLFQHFSALFKNSIIKTVFTFLYVLWVALFPLMMSFYDDVDTAVISWFRIIAFNYLPVMLYFFLFYILLDFILILNWKIKFFHKRMLQNDKFKYVVFLSIVLITSVIVARGIYNFNNTTINKFSISVPKKEGELDHLSIAMAADIHLSELSNEKFVEQFIQKMNSINPDLVILAGDIVDTGTRGTKMKLFEQKFSNLKSKFGVYAIDGNHEIYSGEYRYDFFKNAKIEILRDTIFEIQNSLYLVGRRDRFDKQRRSFDELLLKIKKDLPKLLIDHQPYNLDSAYNNNIDIQFSGHTHNGQLFPINYVTGLIYELSWGYKKINNTHFFVTCGAQGWGPQVKTGSYSEIMLVNVNFN